MSIGTRPFKATVYNPETHTAQSGKSYVKCRLRTSRKDRKTDEWTGEFWSATVFTNATLCDKDKITVDEFTLEQRAYEMDGQKRTAYDMTVWKYTPTDAQSPSPPQPKKPSAAVSDGFTDLSGSDDPLPF